MSLAWHGMAWNTTSYSTLVSSPEPDVRRRAVMVITSNVTLVTPTSTCQYFYGKIRAKIYCWCNDNYIQPGLHQIYCKYCPSRQHKSHNNDIIEENKSTGKEEMHLHEPWTGFGFCQIFFQGNTFIKHVWLNTSYYNIREHFISTGYYEINTIKYHDHEQWLQQVQMTSNFWKVSIFVPVCILIVKIRLSPHTMRLQIILVATMETKTQQSILQWSLSLLL